MNPDELRALADALRPMAKAPCFDGIDIESAADYLRAQADAQPVPAAWRDPDTGELSRIGRVRWRPLYAHPAPAVPAGWKLVPVEPTPEMLQAGASIMDFDRSGWYDADVSRAEYRAMLAAAPTVPQAEPIDPHMIVAEDRFPDVPAEQWKPCPQCGEDFDRECPICDGLGRVLATDSEQAEPKREPLTYEQLVSVCYTYRHDFGSLDPDEQELVIEEAGRWAKAFGIEGSDAE